MKRFTTYIKESENKNYIEEDIKEKIKETIENSGGNFKTFIESFKKTPDEYDILGLINDSDVYDFYLKWRNDIDEILSKINYFSEIPSDNNVLGLYDFVIKGTKRSIKEIINNLEV